MRLLPLAGTKTAILGSIAALMSSDSRLNTGVPVHVFWEETKVAQTLAAAHLENCYAAQLKSMDGAPPPSACTIPPFTQDSMEDKRAAIDALVARLPAIVRSTPETSVWGVQLVDDTPACRSLLAAFLRAREWDVNDADSFLRNTLAWRHQNRIERILESEPVAPEFWFPDDAIRTIDDGTGPDGQPRTIVVLAMGKISLEALRDINAFVDWRIRMQERACHALATHWTSAPHGPKYTLVLDCNGLRPYHFGRACRAALAKLTFVFTHYYPDFVGETVVIHAPSYLRASWRIVQPLMPAWWGVSLGQLSDLGLAAALDPGVDSV